MRNLRSSTTLRRDGQSLDFGGHDAEAAVGFAGARRLDGGVERQQHNRTTLIVAHDARCDDQAWS
jgi:hypothetical protein